MIFCALPETKIMAQTKFIEKKFDAPLTNDKTLVHVRVDGYSDFYIEVILTNTNLLYVNVEELFRTLKIQCIVGKMGDSLSGFIGNDSRHYLIDYNARQIKVGAKTINSTNGMLKEMNVIFMESSLFDEAFGMTINFNSRAMAIVLTENFELPEIKQQLINRLRNNLLKVKGGLKVDTVIKRNNHLFKLGTLDWSLAASQIRNAAADNRFSLSIGSELLYGEADVSVNYFNSQKVDNRSLICLWHWVDNDNTIIKQAEVGNIPVQTIAFINAPVIGLSVGNSSTTLRKASGYYTINEVTEPNWTVMLYINNVLASYTVADAAGLFMFKVPIVYGYTSLKLKFYGPMGEEHTEERTMNIPYTVMPAKEFEYSLSTGIVEDGASSHFGQVVGNYGVTRIFTIGGGLEYLSSIATGPLIPFAKATIQPFGKMIIYGEYDYGVRARGLLDYYFWKDASLEIDYAKYANGQLATLFNANEERKVKLFLPFRYEKFSINANMLYSQFIYKNFIYNESSLSISAYYQKFNLYSITQFNWTQNLPVNILTDLSLSYRLKKGYSLKASAQYNLVEYEFMTLKLEVEKIIPKGYITASYQRNVLFNDNTFSIGFTYNLPFARTSIFATLNNGRVTLDETAQGSMAFGSGNKDLHVSNNPSVGKGGIALFPFLDLNNNGVFDNGEPMVKLNTVRINNGIATAKEQDSIIRITDLNGFTTCLLEFSDVDLDNISWRFKNKTYSVLIDPNQYKRVDIPVIIVGEVNGMVYSNKENALQGMGKILIQVYKKNNNKAVAEILSESDGYIDYIGLPPGEYVARVDSAQLIDLELTSEPKQREFTIKTMREGDIVQDIDFVLSDRNAKEIPKIDLKN
jgi:hypothetical protein